MSRGQQSQHFRKEVPSPLASNLPDPEDGDQLLKAVISITSSLGPFLLSHHCVVA